MAALWDNLLWLDNIFHDSFGKYLNIHRYWTGFGNIISYSTEKNIQVWSESEKIGQNHRYP